MKNTDEVKTTYVDKKGAAFVVVLFVLAALLYASEV